jgi:hypothetical protein
MNVVTGVRNPRPHGAWFFLIALAASLPYWRSLGLPPIEDDYVQIWLGRIYGAPSQWGDLFADPLYRCRATSIVLTRLSEALFGNNQFVFNLQSLLLHMVNALLVAALGRWRLLGYGISLPAAFFWGLSERLHEAVIWYAALPEQLVFFFTLLAFLAWIEWWQHDSRRAYWLATAFFLLALLSKESAVVFCGLALLPLLAAPKRWQEMAFAIAPHAAVSVLYFALILFAKSNHLHWNDGTFQLGWHFFTVILNSTTRIFWFWGGLAMLALYLMRRQVNWLIVGIGIAWILLCLLPYSFVSYMPRVPSRHVYLAMVGRSLILALALGLLWQYRRLAGTVAALFLLYNALYVGIYKRSQFVARANATEQLVETASKIKADAYSVECFPHDPELASLALNQRLGISLSKISASRQGACKVLTVRATDPASVQPFARFGGALKTAQ